MPDIQISCNSYFKGVSCTVLYCTVVQLGLYWSGLVLFRNLNTWTYLLQTLHKMPVLQSIKNHFSTSILL